jgi:hypothetical protein
LLRFLFFFLSFFLSSAKSLSDTFLGDALIKLYETLWEYHMPCKVVLLRVDFFKMAAIGNCGKVCSTDSDFFGLSRFKPYQGYSGNFKFDHPVHPDGYFGMDGLCQIKCR